MRWIFVSIVCCLVFSGLYASEELTVYHAPSYLKFDANNQTIRGSQVVEVISAAFGFSLKKDLAWSGMKAGNPLKRPKAIVAMELDGFSDVNLKLDKISHHLQSDLLLGDTYELLNERINKRYTDSDVVSMEIVNDDSMDETKDQFEKLLSTVATRPFELKDDLFSKSSFLSDKTLTSLNATLVADEVFLFDLQLFFEVQNALKNGASRLRDSVTPDFFWFRSAALQGVIKAYGTKSPQVAEAVELIKNVLKEVDKTLNSIYDDNYLFLVLTVDVESEDHRFRRSLLQATTESPVTEYSSGNMNISPEYDEDYPAIFNIIFFVMLIISLSVFAIALGMWHIDPGRDSIIYRMTSQRIKKDQ